MQDLTEERLSPVGEQEAFRVMFERAGVGVAHVSLNGEWLTVNQSLCEILGYSRSQLLSKTLSEITRFDDLTAELADCRRLLSGTIASFSSEKRHLRGDGRVGWLKTTVTLIRDEENGDPSSYLAIVEDLTPQRKALQHQLVDSDKRFRVLTDNISDLFFTLDAELKCTFWNKAAEALTGICYAEAVGKTIGEALREVSDVSQTSAKFRQVLATQQACRFGLHFKLSGKDLLLEVTAYPTEGGISVVAKDLATARKAEAALRKFARAFEASPAITTIVRISDSCYVEVNRAFEEHTGFLRAEVLGRSIGEVGSGTYLQSLNYAFREAAAQGSIRNMEALVRRKTGETIIVLLSAEAIEFDGQPCVLTVAEDITERKQAEDALRESEERFRVMADNAPIMMWMAGPDKGCTDFNRGWLEFTGRSPGQEKGSGWLAGVHPADREACLSTYYAAFEERRQFMMEYRLRRHDGEYRWTRDTGVPRFLPDGSFVGYIGCCIDVDDQKQAELARADLARRLMTAQEAERTRIARELHDGIGQSVALLGIQLQRAGQPAASGKKNPGVLELCGKLKEIGTQVSRLSHQLHSSELEFLGLAVALKGLSREVSEQYGIKIECLCTDIPSELDNDVALAFLRVGQEGLHNVAKHSRASAVQVRLSHSGDKLTLTIADNGIGFDRNNISSTAGLGMISMRERMHLIGGEFSITSKPDGGTRIQAKAPLHSGAL
jgi:PAS domain S-box-containing protein